MPTTPVSRVALRTGEPRRIRAAALLLAAFPLAACGQGQAEAPPSPKTAVVAHPQPTKSVRYLYETGVAKATKSVDLVARVSGFLQSIDYGDGTEVKAGQRLFLIEPDLYEAQVAQAEASLGEAGATLENARRQLDRQKRLARTAATPEVNVDNARTTAASSEASRVAAQSSLTQARLNLSYTTIAAPFDGFVTEHQADVGALVGSGGVTTLAMIVQLDPIHVSFSISDSAMLKIQKNRRERGLTREDLSGVPVEIATKTDDGFPIQGKLDYVAPQASADTGTLQARAVVPNVDRMLLPGLFVRIRIPLETVDDTLLVPPSAIGTDQEGRHVLVVAPQNVVERRAVTLLERDGALQQVQGALSATDWVVQNVMSGPRPGETVNREEASAEADEASERQAISDAPTPHGAREAQTPMAPDPAPAPRPVRRAEFAPTGRDETSRIVTRFC